MRVRCEKERAVKITDVDVWVVNLPLVNPFTSSFETKTGETRTVVRIRTDTGVDGWGETMWGGRSRRSSKRSRRT